MKLQQIPAKSFWGVGALALLLLSPSCGVVRGYLPPAITPVQSTATDNVDATTGTATMVATGKDHSCAVFSTGNVRCWGKGSSGQLGYGNTNSIGDTENPDTAGDVNVGCTVTSVALGDAHTCALCNSGIVRCWGDNTYGQLGYANTTAIGDDELPYLSGDVLVGGTAVSLAAGANHTCVALDDGSVVCWGKGTDGRLGYGSTANIGDDEHPYTTGGVDVGGSAVQVAAGYAHSCALLSTGTVRCWGSGQSGVLGYGNTNNVGDTSAPSNAGDVPTGVTATAIKSAYLHTCVLTNVGKIRCWGDNTGEALGITADTTIVGDNDTPAQKGSARVSGTFTDVAVGWTETCGKQSNGNWLCWGTSVDIPYGVVFSKVAGGNGWWCGIHSSGNVRCAGDGTDGRLGYGDTTAKTSWPSTPITVEDVGYTQGDTLYASQWHLAGGTYNLGVSAVWAGGNKGTGITVAIVDDGLDISHPDLYANVLLGSSYNYLDGSTNPGTSGSAHGTCVGGVIGARDLNGFGVRGVAPRASIVGYNMLEDATIANMVDSMTRNSSSVYVSNNSWGPTDAIGAYSASPSSWTSAIDSAIAYGRGNLGTSFFWAAGNGALSNKTPVPDATDNSNYDGYANYHGVTAICAVGIDGDVASYSEPGANLWVCGPSQGTNVGFTDGVWTTDLVGSVGFNTTSGLDLTDRAYTKLFNGTSAATPMVAGVAALMYKANPNLTWRDVRWILANTANSTTVGSGYSNNGATPAKKVSYSYGFGGVDASAAVTAAASHTNLGAQVIYTTPTSTNNAGAISDMNVALVSGGMTVSGSGIGKIEFIEVTVNLTHSDWGNLQIQLDRTDAITTGSLLATQHQCLVDDSLNASTADCTNSNNSWRFGTARHWDEPADGTYTLSVTDKENDGKTGTFTSWSMTFYGRAN